MNQIPVVDIGPLFGDDPDSRAATDRRIADAAFDIGFLVVEGHPDGLGVGPRERWTMLELFDIAEADQRPSWKRNFAPENPHVYRGWFPLASSPTGGREGFEIGPDVVRPLPTDQDDDLLYEPTPFPDDALLPDGWRETAARYYLGAEHIGAALLASLSRSLGIDEGIFARAFDDGISTLRLLHYLARDGAATHDDGVYVEHDGRIHEAITPAHVDSGLLTVLATCGVPGLQAQASTGEWIDVPVVDDGFAVNFGGLLERWTGGRIRATRHRVLGQGEERYSVPFFFEPRPSTVIAPLPLEGIESFEPFLYGDHLWAVTTKFSENLGLGYLRPPRGPYTDPLAPSTVASTVASSSASPSASVESVSGE